MKKAFAVSVILGVVLGHLACGKNPASPTTAGPAASAQAPTPTPNPTSGELWAEDTSGAAFGTIAFSDSLVFNNAMWEIGGGNGSSYSSNVWTSSNGVTWTEAKANPAFGGREDSSSVVFNNKMWVIAGFSQTLVSQANDVWSSPDGVNWIAATTAAGFSVRSSQTSVVYDNLMWVIGGFDGDPSDTADTDVWYSADGAHWTEATASAAFGERAGQASVVYDDAMWVIGGEDDYSGGPGYYNDVWYSTNGADWSEATASAPFSARYALTALVYNNAMWVIGGTNSTDYFNDVWTSTDGVHWTEVTSGAPFAKRAYQTSVVYNNAMWVIGGYNGSYFGDVWQSPF